MYDYDDFYQEPSEFDEKIEELKSELSQSVKKEIMDELKLLRKENAELRPIKEDISRLERDYRNKVIKVEREYEDKKRDVRRERISELFKDCGVEYWMVARSYKTGEKCDKCDKNRRINYKTPSNRDAWESCSCAEQIPVYEPIPTVLKSLSFRDGKANAWYKVRYEGTDDEYLDCVNDTVGKGEDFITEENQIDTNKTYYRAMFETKELAQIYCDLKNKENEVIKEDNIDIELEETEDDGIKKRNI